MKKLGLLFVVFAVSCVPALALSQYLILHQFAGTGTDGAYPTGDLVFDRAGNIFGTTSIGGNGNYCYLGCGIVFELSLNNGSWTYSIVYEFCSNSKACLDGAFPQAGLVVDAAGNLYGTTLQGGSEQSGTVFELSPPSPPGGAWTETVLHSFCTKYGCIDGYFPYSKLLLDSRGGLYGTTSAGGDNTNCRDGCGTVFRLRPPLGPGKHWTEDVIYTFCPTPNFGFCPDGATLMVGLAADKDGNLYGTTQLGGKPHSDGHGTIYRLTRSLGSWTESVLFVFPPTAAPVGELALDRLSRIYGVSPYAGGVVYRLDAESGQVRSLSLENEIPTSGVLVDSDHAVIYGTTPGGPGYSQGLIFKITAPAQETPLHIFCDQFQCEDGGGPASGLIEDLSGNLYGTTEYGGFGDCRTPIEEFPGCGVLFQLIP
jgi:uncharacterized repeat protein (TIGR03803 family)